MEDILIKLLSKEEEMKEVLPLRLAWVKEEIGIQLEEPTELQNLIRRFEQGRNFWIGKNKDRIAGYCCGYDLVDIYISDGVFVYPAFRNMGIGSKLKRVQIEHARKQGYDSILSHVKKDNLSSIRMQKKTGAKITKSSDYPDYENIFTYIIEFR